MDCCLLLYVNAGKTLEFIGPSFILLEVRDPECVVSLLLITDMMGDISRKLVPRDDHGIEVPKDACRLHGSIPVDKVKGNFHILSGLYNLRT